MKFSEKLMNLRKSKGMSQEQYEAKHKESDSLTFGVSDWFAKKSQLQREITDINSQITTLKSEKFQIENANYAVYYPLVEDITYLIFYYIAAGVFAIISLIALIYFLVTRKK